MIPNIENWYEETIGDRRRKWLKGVKPWQLTPDVIEKYGTVTVDETQNNHTSNPLVMMNRKNFVLGVMWQFKIDGAIPDNPWSTFDHVTFYISLDGHIFDELKTETYPLLSRLTGQRRIARKMSDGSTIFEFPMLFDCLVGDNLLPLTLEQRVQFGWSKPPHIQRVTGRCLVTYLNTDSTSLIPELELWNQFNRSTFYRQQNFFSLVDANNLSFDFSHNLIHSVVGIYFAFFKDRVIVRQNLLRSIKLTINQHTLVTLKDPKIIFGKSSQFLPIEQPATEIDCNKARPVLFPVEVWRVIIQHLENPHSLMVTCKYLWKICHFHNIRDVLYEKFNPATGWYCIPFHPHLLRDYKMENCSINFSRVDNSRLCLEFLKPTSPDTVLRGIAVSQNGFTRMNHMMGLIYAW